MAKKSIKSIYSMINGGKKTFVTLKVPKSKFKAIKTPRIRVKRLV